VKQIMKQFFKYLFIGTLLFSCSPKFTELNDQGFGGGFSQKRIATKARENTNLACKETQNGSTKVDVLLSTSVVNHSATWVSNENTKKKLHHSILGKSKLENIKIFKHRITEIFQPVKKAKQTKFSDSASGASTGKWVSIILGIITFILGLSIYSSNNVTSTAAGVVGTVSTAFSGFMMALGVVVAILGIILLIIGLLMN